MVLFTATDYAAARTPKHRDWEQQSTVGAPKWKDEGLQAEKGLPQWPGKRRGPCGQGGLTLSGQSASSGGLVEQTGTRIPLLAPRIEYPDPVGGGPRFAVQQHCKDWPVAFTTHIAVQRGRALQLGLCGGVAGHTAVLTTVTYSS